jgi:HPt (histidine-containing phosphotransfer) domain-containing protein
MIKWSRVAELRDEIGEEDFADVIDLFIDEVEEVVNRLRLTLSLPDLEQDLHFLKGSALCLGFERFSDLCQDGERRAAAGDAANVDLPEILDAYEQSKIQFLTELPNLKAA